MKKYVIGVLLAIVLTGVLITSTYAMTVSIEASIGRDFAVVFEFTVDNGAIYTNLKNSPQLMNETTVPSSIWTDFVSKGHTNLNALTYSDVAIFFNDTRNSIRSTFHLSGLDIINSTIDKQRALRPSKCPQNGENSS